ncbi:MAG TPA: bifunctional phosphoglucose/phosphomannose isomerase, partial [Rubricoccaceae bacterium]|nr:bifunctional phosphoglucose/phosphomannose isomerase [Rubricoccaceae bacterium]
DLVRTLAEPDAPVPIQVLRGYDLPAWVCARTLVVASSYSGDTEETLSALDQAERRGSAIVAVTSGGALLRRAEREGYRHVVIPVGLQPRAALGYSLGVLLRVARAPGFLHLTEIDFEDTLDELRARADRLAPAASSPALDLADRLVDRLPVVYTGTGLLEAVGLRWRTQLHENAKVFAVGNVLPELNHNEIMGFEAAPEAVRERLAVVVLRDREDHPQVLRRIEATRDLIAPRVADWIEVETEGESRLARQLSLVQLGDWVSFWLAMRLGVDPTPVGTIQQLKATLAG